MQVPVVSMHVMGFQNNWSGVEWMGGELYTVSFVITVLDYAM